MLTSRTRLCSFLSLILTAAAPANERSLAVVFGPLPEEPARLAAESVAGSAREWLKASGANLELWRPGVREPQELNKYVAPKDFDKAFQDVARVGRESVLVDFLNALDRATYSLANRPGKRVLIAVLASPSPAVAASMKGGLAEAENRLSQTAEFCKANAITVLVVDPSAP
jgi:hypothetical protein